MADIAFTVGIMSLMDALFGIPMADLVEQIPVERRSGQALVDRSRLLRRAAAPGRSIEQMEEGTACVPALGELAASGDDLIELEMAAFEWSDRSSASAL